MASKFKAIIEAKTKTLLILTLPSPAVNYPKLTEMENFKKENNFEKRNRSFIEKPIRFDMKKLNRIPKDTNIGKIIKTYFKNDGKDSKLLTPIIKLFSKVEIKNVLSPYSKYSQPKMNESLNLNLKLLLWCGVNNVQLLEICNNGFEIPKTHGKLGGGYYFSDRVGDCIEFCNQNNGFMILCEVAVGKMFRYAQRRKFSSPPRGFDSIKFLGKYTPDKNEVEKYNKDVIIPIGGTMKNSRVENSEFEFNKYVVFEKMRYQIRFIVEFENKSL